MMPNISIVETGRLSLVPNYLPGAELATSIHNGENLRLYRKQKTSDGQRRIKKQRYRYQPKDFVQFEGKIYEVIGMQNLGTGVKLKNYPGIKNKVVNVGKVKSIKRRSGLRTKL